MRSVSSNGKVRGLLGPREKAQSGTTHATTQPVRATLLAHLRKQGRQQKKLNPTFTMSCLLILMLYLWQLKHWAVGGQGGLKFISQIGDRIATRTGEKR